MWMAGIAPAEAASPHERMGLMGNAKCEGGPRQDCPTEDTGLGDRVVRAFRLHLRFRAGLSPARSFRREDTPALKVRATQLRQPCFPPVSSRSSQTRA